MLNDLLTIINEQGITASESRTAKHYDKPTLEVYKSGGLRIRGLEPEQVERVKQACYYDITGDTLKLFTTETTEQAKQIKAKLNRGHTYTTKQNGDPNISVSVSEIAELYQAGDITETANKGVSTLELEIAEQGETLVISTR